MAVPTGPSPSAAGRDAGPSGVLDAPVVATVAQDWGFGMAPLKPTVRDRRVLATRRLLRYLQSGHLEPRGRLEELAADLPEVKGLLTRAWRQDQWGPVHRVGGSRLPQLAGCQDRRGAAGRTQACSP